MWLYLAPSPSGKASDFGSDIHPFESDRGCSKFFKKQKKDNAMNRVAVYTGTKNLYPYMLTSAKSLIIHSNVQKIYFMIEDDTFPLDLPDMVECRNVSNQEYFLPDSPNMKTRFTYMSMMRAVLAKEFPDLDRILSLDVDIIIEKDISDIWELPIDDFYMAMCKELKPYKQTDEYFNAGVVLQNLKKLREDGMVEKFVKNLNETRYILPEQDSFNKLCKGKVLNMDSKYNVTPYTYPTDDPHVIHYAGLTDWYDMPEVKEYERIPVNELQRAKKSVMKSAFHKIMYMIHACPEREWYVKEFLIPSMIEQGINEDDIVIWNSDGRNNIDSFMECAKYVGESFSYIGGIWHMQDDVVISKTFRERTEKFNNGIVCGFCAAEFEGGNVNLIGVQPVAFMWFSFQCIRIPNIYMKQCADWFYNVAKPQKIFRDYWLE